MSWHESILLSEPHEDFIAALFVMQLEAQYFHEHAAFTTAVGLKKSPAVDFSATIGTPTIAFGVEANYMPASGKFSKYNAGMRMTKPDYNISVIL